MQADKNYYEILKVDKKAAPEQIRTAYRSLASQCHPDVSDTPDAVKVFQELQEAYEVLGDPTQRRTYDGLREASGFDKPSAVTLQTVVSHEALLTNVAEQVFYVSLNITPASDLPTSRLPLNLCLVLDRSTSMQGMRLRNVKEATYQIIEQLNDDDALSLVVFSDRAQVVFSSPNNIDKPIAKSNASAIQPGGGTEMFQGLQAGLEELEANSSQSSVNHMILLTDGRTYGDESQCLEKAKWAGYHQISLSVMGLGSDWNEDLLDQIAVLSGGESTYIESSADVVNVFKTALRELSTVVARELTMQINTSAGVTMVEAFQTLPNIQRMPVHGNKIILGPLNRTQGKKLLIEFKVTQQTTPGRRQLARVKVNGDIPVQGNYRNWESIDFFGEFVLEPKQNHEIPVPIVETLRKLALFKIQAKAMADVENGKFRAASQRLEALATQLLNMGEAELARVTLLEAGRLARTGHLSDTGRKQIHYGTRALSM